MPFLKRHPYISIFAAGALSSLSFAPLYIIPLLMLGMSFAWYTADLFQSFKKSVLIGYLFGFGHFMTGFYWVGNALLVDISSFGWLYPIALFGLGSFFGLFLIPPFMVWYFFKKVSLWERLCAFSATFVLMEYLRAYFLTGFPWNMAGSIFAFSTVTIQSASFIGTYGLSLIACFMSAGLYALFQKKYKSGFSVLITLSGFLIIFGFYRLTSLSFQPSEIKVRLVQPSIPQSMKFDKNSLENNLQTYIDMSRQNASDDISFVVWGETATSFDLEHSPYFQAKIQEAVPQNGYLMTGMLRYDSSYRLYNTMGVFDKNGKMVTYYDKNHLVPFGEYIPFRKYLPSFIHPVTNAITDLSVTEKYKKLHVKGLPPFSALVCYEIIFPDQVLNRSDKPSFIVLVSNDGWYGNSFGPYQHLDAAKMRAVEEGITIIRSANNGISAVIEPTGRIRKRLALNEKGILDITLQKPFNIQTFYASSHFSTILFVVLSAFLIILFAKTSANQKKKH